MSDIFISYRRGKTDTWVAGRLHDRLRQHFAVFFDTSRQSADYGDDIGEGIDEALSTCRVLFAVIGPDWSIESNFQRLSEEKDWVAHELRQALGRPRIRVIPLLVGETAGPALKKLSGALAPLSTRIWRTLNSDIWDNDVEDLVRSLRNDWLAGRRESPGARSAALPSVLPYLCNRSDQEVAFVDLVQTTPTKFEPIACVVHGFRDEAHDELLVRLRHGGTLEEILGAPDVGTAPKQLQISRERLRDGRFADALKSGLKAALNRRHATDEELRAFLLAFPQPLVVVLQLTWSDYRDVGDGLVQGLVKAWKELPRGSQDEPPPQLSYPWLLWINFTYDDIDAKLTDDLLATPLPRLEPVEERDIREWVALDNVRPHVEHRKNELLDLADNARYYFTPGKVHMRHFADGVIEIVSEP